MRPGFLLSVGGRSRNGRNETAENCYVRNEKMPSGTFPVWKNSGTAGFFFLFVFFCFSVESNQLIEFTAVKVFVKRFFYLFILCIVIDVVQLRLFVGVIGVLGVTIEPNLSVIVLSVFVKRHQNDVILALYFENGNDGTGYIRAVIQLQFYGHFFVHFFKLFLTHG